MRERGSPGIAPLFLLGMILAAGFWGCAAAPERPPLPTSAPTVLPPLGPGEIRGRLFLSGNKVLRQRVEVRENRAGVSVESGPEGGYRLLGLPAGKAFLVVDGKIGGKRHLAVDVVLLGEGKGETVDLQLRDASNVDTFCVDCHPYRGEATRGGQILRDLHKSDIKPVKAVKGIELLDERGHVTCESCHTVHKETGVEDFVHLPFRTGELCVQCHE